MHTFFCSNTKCRKLSIRFIFIHYYKLFLYLMKSVVYKVNLVLFLDLEFDCYQMVSTQDTLDKYMPFRACQGISCSPMTVEQCSKYCFEDQDYQYLGLMDRTECFCGNHLHPTKIDKSECSESCLGDSQQNCGAWLKMSVYKRPGMYEVSHA